MGNTPEKPSEIVTVKITDTGPKEDPITKVISHFECVIPT